MVTYESGPYGHLANVNYEEGGYVAPVETYTPAPSYETPAPSYETPAPSYEPAYVEPAYENVNLMVKHE